MSTRHTGSRFARHLEKNCKLEGKGRKCCRFDSIRSIRDDPSALMSTRHTGSQFARHLEKNCKLANREGSKMLSIRLDSIDSRRFVRLDVDPSYRKSICATYYLFILFTAGPPFIFLSSSWAHGLYPKLRLKAIAKVAKGTAPTIRKFAHCLSKVLSKAVSSDDNKY